MLEYARIKKGYYDLMDRLIVDYLVKIKTNPNWLTTGGSILSIPAGILIWSNNHFAAVIFVFLSCWCDSIDGSVARKQNRVTRIGSLYDSFFDRLSEIVIFLGIAAYFYSERMFLSILLTFFTICISLLVSYLRSKAESLGFECATGLMQRTGRMITLMAGILLNVIFRNYLMVSGQPRAQDLVLLLSLLIITFFSLYTVIQRLIHVSKQALSKETI